MEDNKLKRKKTELVIIAVLLVIVVAAIVVLLSFLRMSFKILLLFIPTVNVVFNIRISSFATFSR